MPLPKYIPQSTKKDVPARRCLANRYTVEKKLGCGNFGTAWLVTDKKAKDEKDKLKVVKEIGVGDLQPDETVDAMHEASLLRNLDHPGIVKFHDSFIDTQFFCIVTEFCEGGDLDAKICEFRHKKKRFSEGQVLEWTIELLLALQYMHERRVLHRDLKTRNIFLRNNMIKVGDFGISRILMGTTDMASTFVGTPYYMSPEVLKHEGYNSKSDVWSVGCILYELASLKHAFEGQSLMGVMYKIVEGALPTWPKHYSPSLLQVFTRICEKDPAKRPSASDALKLPYIAAQMELLKNTMIDKHQSKEQKDTVNRESQQLAAAIKQPQCLKEVRRDSEERKLRNLPPRERMRLRKQQQADQKARRMEQAAKDQFIHNRTSYQENKQHMNPYETQLSVAWGKQKRSLSSGDTSSTLGDSLNDSGTLIGAPYTAPYKLNIENSEEETESEDDYDDDDVIIPVKTKTVNLNDERPITPMKNTMIYDREHSSLDFKDGIPENPELANTFYSQFDGDFDAGDDDDDDDDEGEMEEDVEDLIHCMQTALDRSETMQSQTLVADDTTTGAFGSALRETKIKNLKAEAVRKLGRAQFERAYHYLKEARFSGQDNSKADEAEIMKGLAKLVPNPNDCFIVDQLLFLEQ